MASNWMWIFTVVIVAAVSAANVSNSCVVTPLYRPPITCLVIETYKQKDHTHQIRAHNVWWLGKSELSVQLTVNWSESLDNLRNNSVSSSVCPNFRAVDRKLKQMFRFCVVCSEWTSKSIWMMQSVHSMKNLQDQRTPCSSRSTIFVCATWFCRSGLLLCAHLRINAQDPLESHRLCVINLFSFRKDFFPRRKRRNSPRLITTILALTIFNQ